MAGGDPDGGRGLREGHAGVASGGVAAGAVPGEEQGGGGADGLLGAVHVRDEGARQGGGLALPGEEQAGLGLVGEVVAGDAGALPREPDDVHLVDARASVLRSRVTTRCPSCRSA